MGFSKGGGLTSNTLRKNSAKYRPHRPHVSECFHLQVLYAVDTFLHHRPQVGHYRPRKVPPEDRPCMNYRFCRSFSSCKAVAGGEGDTSRLSLPYAVSVVFP